MEQLMYKFLETTNPKLFMLKTKFGITPYHRNGDNYVISDEKRKVAHKLCDFFSCDYLYACLVYDKWLQTKPVCVRVVDPEDSTKSIYVPA